MRQVLNYTYFLNQLQHYSAYLNYSLEIMETIFITFKYEIVFATEKYSFTVVLHYLKRSLLKNENYKCFQLIKQL